MSPFCSIYASCLQQQVPDVTVKDLIDQTSITGKVKRFGTVLLHPHPADRSEYRLTVLKFIDASKAPEYDPVGAIIRLLAGKMKSGSIFHTGSWLSHKSKRPVKVVLAAKVLATTKGFDESKVVLDA